MTISSTTHPSPLRRKLGTVVLWSMALVMITLGTLYAIAAGLVLVFVALFNFDDRDRLQLQWTLFPGIFGAGFVAVGIGHPF